MDLPFQSGATPRPQLSRAFRWAYPFAVLALVATHVGCAGSAARGLRQAAASSYAGDPMPTNRDLVDGRPDDADDAFYYSHKAAKGRMALQRAIRADPAIEAYVAESGRPEGIAVDNAGMRVTLYYLDIGTAVIFEPTSDVAEEMPRRERTESRPIREDEREAILSNSSRRDVARLVRRLQTQLDRVARIGYRVIAAAPPGDEQGYRSGFLAIAASTPLLKALDQPTNVKGIVVLWVDSEGPARDLLRPGDMIVALNDRRIYVPGDYDLPPNSQRIDLVVSRDGIERPVRIEPQRLPRPVEVGVLPTETLNAGANEKLILINSGLERACDDDMLAAVVGHELGHIVSRDAEVGPTITTLAALPFMPIYFIPVLGQVAGNATQGIENRYNREQEFRADRLAVQYAAAAGFDPRGAIRVLEAFDRTSKIPAMAAFFGIHPPNPERIAAMKAEIERLETGEASTGSAWTPHAQVD